MFWNKPGEALYIHVEVFFRKRSKIAGVKFSSVTQGACVVPSAPVSVAIKYRGDILLRQFPSLKTLVLPKDAWNLQ